VINENMAQAIETYDSYVLPGTSVAKSSIYTPIIVSDTVRGMVCLSDFKHEHAFSDSDVRLLETLVNNMSVALENARLFDETQRLVKAEQERISELEIINSIQKGLAAELDFQAIIDLVGDKLREVFHSTDMMITWYEEKTNLAHYLYNYVNGNRMTIEPRPPAPGGLLEQFSKSRQPDVWKTSAERALTPTVEGTGYSKSGVAVPIISSDRIIGIVQLYNMEQENAFGESEIRLLTTIAASLGTALENARLFDETQRLFKAEQERVSELQIINSIQQGLAAELDFNAIIDLVGDKLSEVLHTDNLGIRWYDEKANLVHYLYQKEHGKRLIFEPSPPTPGGILEQWQRTRNWLPVVSIQPKRLARGGRAGTD
jgi:GAF domain-containing protein